MPLRSSLLGTGRHGRWARAAHRGTGPASTARPEPLPERPGKATAPETAKSLCLEALHDVDGRAGMLRSLRILKRASTSSPPCCSERGAPEFLPESQPGSPKSKRGRPLTSPKAPRGSRPPGARAAWRRARSSPTWPDRITSPRPRGDLPCKPCMAPRPQADSQMIHATYSSNSRHRCSDI